MAPVSPDTATVELVLNRWGQLLPAVRDSLPTGVLELLPAAGASPAVFEVSSSSSTRLVLRCQVEYVFNPPSFDYRMGYSDPEAGIFIPTTFYMFPGSSGLKHRRSTSLLVSDLHIGREHVVARVQPHPNPFQFYFFRNDGIEDMITREPRPLHPGYSAIHGEFWVVAPRRHVKGVRVLSPVPPSMVSTDRPGWRERAAEVFAYSPDPPWAKGGSGEAEALLLADPEELDVRLTGELPPESPVGWFLARDPARGLEYVDQHISALAGLMPAGGSHYRDLYWPYYVRLLLCLSQEDVAGAKDALGQLLHLDGEWGPGWPASALAGPPGTILEAFFQRHQEEITRTWEAVLLDRGD